MQHLHTRFGIANAFNTGFILSKGTVTASRAPGASHASALPHIPHRVIVYMYPGAAGMATYALLFMGNVS